MAGYPKTPLGKNLGLKPGQRIALVNAPPGFPALLGDLPAGARLLQRAKNPVDLTLWFVANLRTLEHGMPRQTRRPGRDGSRMMWPKQASGVATDVGQTGVLRAGLGAGPVDVKIAAIDATRSGLKFTRRRR